VQHHGRQGNPQPERGLRAIKDAGIAVPAFFRISHLGNFSRFVSGEDIRGTAFGAKAAAITGFRGDKRRHSKYFLLRLPSGSKSFHFPKN
jgi:hypothetical protein